MMFIRISISSSLEMCTANEERLVVLRKIHKQSVQWILLWSAAGFASLCSDSHSHQEPGLTHPSSHS